jgi:glucosamine kinase
MPPKAPASDATYFLGFDGGGTKTDCVLADAEGRVLARGSAGPSNPLRCGYARAWFSLSDAGDAVLSLHKIHSGNIAGICAGLGGAGRTGVAHRVNTFFQGAYPNATVRVTTDLEIALESAFGSGEGMILLAGTGSAAFGRDGNGRTSRAGGRGPWFSDEGSAFDIGRRAFRAVSLAEEHRGPSTGLSERILAWHDALTWDFIGEQIVKNPDAVFPKTFPLVTELADAGDAVAQGILAPAAASLVELAVAVVEDLAWRNREFSLAKVGGVHGGSKYYDACIDAELERTVPRARVVPVVVSPAEAAARMAARPDGAKGNAT